MKEKIMKLSVLVGVPAIALFIMVGMASADPSYSIQGEYAVTGLDTCEPGSGIMEGDYAFRHDGTGSMSGTIRRFPNDAVPFPVMYLSAEFTYTVTKEGRINFDYSGLGGLTVEAEVAPDVIVPIMILSAGPSHGVISRDGNMITISCGPPALLTATIYTPGGPINGVPMMCITSLVGMRIK
jgi:hypothetical protein